VVGVHIDHTQLSQFRARLIDPLPVTDVDNPHSQGDRSAYRLNDVGRRSRVATPPFRDRLVLAGVICVIARRQPNSGPRVRIPQLWRHVHEVAEHFDTQTAIERIPNQ
jgi:hypothetical protein